MARGYNIEIDWEEFDKLCQLQCTQHEIAGWFDCSVDTINRRVKETFNISFYELWRQKAAKGQISLRRVQMQKALEGNVPLLIWLGKQCLGQTDKVESDHKVTPKDIQINYVESKELLNGQDNTERLIENRASEDVTPSNLRD